LKIDMTSFFSAKGGPIWIKFRKTGAERYVDCGDMAEIENKSRLPIWRMFGRIQWHVIPEPPATLQGAATMPPGEFNDMSSQSHVSRCRVQSPGEISVVIVPHCRV